MCIRDREKEYNQDIIDLLALKVTADFEPKIKNSLIQVEDIPVSYTHLDVYKRQRLAGVAPNASRRRWRNTSISTA